MNGENLFSIRNLISISIKSELETETDTNKKVNLLIKLLDYENEYAEKAEEISEYYCQQVGDRYECGDIFLSNDDKDFLLEFAEKIRDFDEVVKLFDKLCNSNFYDYDSVIAEATQKLSMIRDIDDFEVTGKTDDKKAENAEKSYRSLSSVLKFKQRAEKAKKTNG